MKRFNRVAIAGAIALTLTLTVGACGTTKGGDSGQVETGPGGVKTGLGITKDTITLGNLTDTSGVFKDIGIAISHGIQIWADDVNNDGGICDRQIKIDTRDTGYQADTAVTQYAAMNDEVAGMVQLLGSPIIAALKSQLVSDHMVTIPATQAATNLAIPGVMMVGPSYDIEVINLLAYAQKNGLIAEGQKLGHIYIDSEYGQSGLNGSQYYAKLHGQTIVPIPVSPSDADMAAAVTKLKSDGVSAVILTTTSAQLSSTATQMAAQGMGAMPILGSNPTFSPTLPNTPAMSALGNYYRVVGIAPYGSDTPLMQKIATTYEATYNAPPEDHINTGYAFGLTMQAALEKACDNEDMTRPGIVKAAKQVDNVDTGGITAPLDFTRPLEPSTLKTFIEQIDPAAPGGLVVVQDLTVSDEAKDYTSPLLK